MRDKAKLLQNLSYEIQMEVAGNTAIWTRPDSGDSPMSYPAPTYSAVKAMFESVLFWENVLIEPQKVEICKPLQYHSYATNYGGPLRISSSIKADNQYQLFATVLTDVCYKLYANVRAVNYHGESTSPAHAFSDIFQRRLERGQSFATIHLGWSEFTAGYVGPFRESTTICENLPTIEIPSMLHAVFNDGYESNYRPVYDTNVRIENGVLYYNRSGGELHDDKRTVSAEHGT